MNDTIPMVCHICGKPATVAYLGGEGPALGGLCPLHHEARIARFKQEQNDYIPKVDRAWFRWAHKNTDELRKRAEFDVRYDEERGKLIILDRQQDTEYTVAIELILGEILGIRAGEAILET